MNKINSPGLTRTSISAEEKEIKNEKQILYKSKNNRIEKPNSLNKEKKIVENNNQSIAGIEAKLKKEMDLIFNNIKNRKDTSKVLVKISDVELASKLGATKPLPTPTIKIKNKSKPLPMPPRQSKTQAQSSTKQAVVSPRSKPLPIPPVLKNKITTPANNTPVMFNPLGIGELMKKINLFKQAIAGNSELAEEIANNLNQHSNHQSVTSRSCYLFASHGLKVGNEVQKLKPEIRKEIISFASSWIDLKISQGSMGAYGTVWDQALTQLAIEIKNNWKI